MSSIETNSEGALSPDFKSRLQYGDDPMRESDLYALERANREIAEIERAEFCAPEIEALEAKNRRFEVLLKEVLLETHVPIAPRIVTGK